jgi:hypothetical protein
MATSVYSSFEGFTPVWRGLEYFWSSVMFISVYKISPRLLQNSTFFTLLHGGVAVWRGLPVITVITEGLYILSH